MKGKWEDLNNYGIGCNSKSRWCRWGGGMKYGIFC